MPLTVIDEGGSNITCWNDTRNFDLMYGALSNVRGSGWYDTTGLPPGEPKPYSAYNVPDESWLRRGLLTDEISRC
jgi:hypothetical protein